jgi:hypothetical protein
VDLCANDSTNQINFTTTGILQDNATTRLKLLMLEGSNGVLALVVLSAIK